jgi:hypothetical protein
MLHLRPLIFGQAEDSGGPSVGEQIWQIWGHSAAPAETTPSAQEPNMTFPMIVDLPKIQNPTKRRRLPGKIFLGSTLGKIGNLFSPKPSVETIWRCCRLLLPLSRQLMPDGVAPKHQGVAVQ